jgi:hypothetical protein
LLRFAARVRQLNLTMEAACEKACKMVEKEAKRVIGGYDYGWTPLAEATKEDRAAHGFPADEPLLRTGEMRDSIEHNVGREGSQVVGLVGTNHPIAKYQELGTSHIPPRSFLGEAAMHKEGAIHRMMGKAIIGTFWHGGGIYHGFHMAYEAAKRLVDEVIEDEEESR